MKYSQSIAERITELVASGKYTILDICKQVDISKETFYEWKKSKPDFSDAFKKAEKEKLNSLAAMATSGLAKLLDIHEYEEVTTEYEDDGKGKPKIKARKVVKKFIMPNPTAVIFTLKNRDPENWKDKVVVDATNKNLNFNVEMTKEEIKVISDALEDEY